MPTLLTQLAALQSGRTNSQALVLQSADRIEQAASLNAFITVDKTAAIARAKKLDEMRRNGSDVGPLGGIVLSVKDNIHVAGLANTAGTPALRHFVPDESAGVVKRLETAGAIIIGKNNMHELAYGITSNNTGFGAVGNAYKPQYIAGGSSGGTAVAIATGMVSAGLGTDTGGSTRIPAALNGIAGFRPTTGRYPSKGLTRISNTRDTVGPMARTVEDIVLLDMALTGKFGERAGVELSGLRLGVPRAYFYQNLEPEVAARTEAALQILQQAGVELIAADIENLGAINDKVGFPIVLYETKILLEKYTEENIPGGSLTGIVKEIASPDVKAVMDSVVSGAITEAVYRDAIEVYRPRLQQAYRDYFAAQQLDGMIFPTTVLTARPIDGSLETIELNGEQLPTFPTYIHNTDPASNAGIPALSIPAGLSDSGLPIGLEIDGPEGSDSHLLAVGVAIQKLFESHARTRTPPPGVQY